MVNALAAWLSGLFGRRGLARVAGSWGTTSTSLPGELFGIRASSSGANVTDDAALSISAVFAGVRFLSTIISHLPLSVNKRVGGRKMDAENHPAWRVLKYRPNPFMTAQTFRAVMEWNRCLGGAAYAEIQWNAGGNVAALWPIEYWRVKPKWDDKAGQLKFIVDGVYEVAVDDMLYIPQVSWDGMTPTSFLEYAVESLGVGISQQACAATFFGNGARPSGFLKHSSNVNEEQRKAFRKSWESQHGGPANQNRVGILWGGWEWQDIPTLNAEQAQLLDSRRFTVEEVARWLNLPPHILRDLSRATFSNIEHQSIELVTMALNPILTAYEAEFDLKLLDPPRVYCKHNVNALMRGDSVTRGQFYRNLHMVGALSANDILELEDMNPIGEEGDLRFVPANLKSLEEAKRAADGEAAPSPVGGQPAPAADVHPPDVHSPDPNQPGPGGAGDGQSGQDFGPMLGMVADVFRRFLKVERTAVERAAKKPATFLKTVGEFYEKHERKLAEALLPTGEKMEWISAVAFQHCERSLNALRDAGQRVELANGLPGRCKQLFDDWIASRPEEQAAEYFNEA